MSPCHQRKDSKCLPSGPLNKTECQTVVSGRTYSVDTDNDDGYETPLEEIADGQKFGFPLTRGMSRGNFFLSTNEMLNSSNISTNSEPARGGASTANYDILESASDSQASNKLLAIMKSVGPLSSSDSEDDKDPIISANISAMDALDRYQTESRMCLNVDTEKLEAKSSSRQFQTEIQVSGSVVEGNPDSYKSVSINCPERVIHDVDPCRQTDVSVLCKIQSELGPLEAQLNEISGKCGTLTLAGMSLDLHPIGNFDSSNASATARLEYHCLCQQRQKQQQQQPCCKYNHYCHSCPHHCYSHLPCCHECHPELNFHTPRWQQCATKDNGNKKAFQPKASHDVSTNTEEPARRSRSEIPNSEQQMALDEEEVVLFSRSLMSVQVTESTIGNSSCESIIQSEHFPARTDSDRCSGEATGVAPDELSQLAEKYALVRPHKESDRSTRDTRSSPEDFLRGSRS